MQGPLPSVDLWERLVKFARHELGDRAFHTLTASSTPLDFDGNTLTLAVPDQFTAQWNEEKFAERLASCAPIALGYPVTVRFQIEQERQQRVQMDLFVQQSPTLRREHSEVRRSHGLNERYTFANFVVGRSNELAAAAAAAIAQVPGRLYNPLFIYGDTGLGKTHLMQAIGHDVASRHPERRITYVPAENFTNAYIDSIQNRGMSQFRRRFRELDILLIDDVHFLRGKEATQEEFFHTFNSLYEAGRQIVLTSDRPPAEIPGVEARLVSRFQWGTVANIDYPDTEHRIAILRRKLQNDQLAPAISDPILHLLAQEAHRNIRDLEGAVVTLLAFASLRNEPITLTLAREALQTRGHRSTHSAFSNTGEAPRYPSITDVQTAVASTWGTTTDGLRSKSRLHILSQPRHAAMLLCRELCNSSLSDIGTAFGGRDHSTVIHGIQRARKQQDADPTFARKLSSAQQLLKLSPQIPQTALQPATHHPLGS